MARRPLATTYKEIKQRRDELFEQLSKESARGVVLISAAFLDEALGAFLRARISMRHPKSKRFIKDLFKGPLQHFSPKIKMCYAMDLIGKWMYQDLETVKKLRNDYFGHNVGTTRFDSPEVVQLTKTLKAADLAATQLMKKKASTKKSKKTKATKKNISQPTKADKELLRFTMSVSFIGALLYILTKILSSDEKLEVKEGFVEMICRNYK